MIGAILRFLFGRPWGLVLLGFLIASVGVAVTVDGHTELPERAQLMQVSGVLGGAVKITRRRSGVNYELEITNFGGFITLAKLTLPEREISEDTVKMLLGRPIVALYSGTKNVWELTSGDAKVIDYERTRQKRTETKAFQAELGPYVGGGGVLVSLTGVVWLVRRRRAAERVV